MTHEEAVRQIWTVLEDMGGREALKAPDVPAAYVMARNWNHARRMEALGGVPRSVRLRAKWAERAKTEPEAWDAMVLIIGLANEGRFDSAWYTVKRAIGERPKRSGRHSKALMTRNEFVHDSTEYLMGDPGMTLSESLRVLADVLYMTEEAAGKSRKAYLRMIETHNPEFAEAPSAK